MEKESPHEKKQEPQSTQNGGETPQGETPQKKSRSRSRSRRRRRRRSRSRSRSRSRRRKKKRRSRRSRSRSRSRSRKRKKKSAWDMKPEDFPNGAPPAGAFGGSSQPFVNSLGMQVDPKKARTAYIGGLSPGCGIDATLLRRFFEDQLPRVKDRPPVRGPAVETVSMNSNGVYGFVEFYNSFDADISMCMDGMSLNGIQLQIRRPRNFTPDPNTKKYHIPGLISSQVPDGPNKIFLGSLPINLNDSQVQAIAGSFGQLQAFSLVKERDSIISKGYAFFSYVDTKLTQMVVNALNGKEIQGKMVVCKIANQKNADVTASRGTLASLGGMGGMGGMVPGMMPGMMGGMMPNPMLGGGGAPGMPGFPLMAPPSPFLCMANMVTPDELKDDAEYRDILEDVRSECSNYGQLVQVSIPRPPHPQSGKIYLQYANAQQSTLARNSLSGRTFSDRLIRVDFIQQHQMVLA